MERRTTRVLGALAAVGGLLAIVVWVPPRWYGSTTGDSYVFDPPTFSPLWVERTLVPLLTVLASALLVAGLVALVVRDRPVAGRLRRLGGYVAVVGVVALGLAEVVFAVVGGAAAGGADDLTAILGVLFGLLVGGVGAVLALAGMVALGVGYRRAGRRVVGSALVAGPLLTVGVLALFFVVDAGGLGTPLLVAPAALAFVVVGYELWTHPDPVPGPGGRSGGGPPEGSAGGDPDADGGPDDSDDPT